MGIRYKLNGKFVSQEEFAAATNPARFDEMVEAGVAPGCMTDSVFLQGRSNQFVGDEFSGDYIRQVSERAGQDTQGKTYISGLAAYPGDPEAWVSGRGDVQRVCEQRGWGCEGAVTVKRPELEPPPRIDVAPDLIEEHVERRMEANPALAERPRDEVAHEVKESLKPDWKK